MDDLIKRADAIEAVYRKYPYNAEQNKCDEIIDALEALPSAGAVVYCMDCAKSEPLDEHGALWKCKAHDRTTLRHSYCNNGERRILKAFEYGWNVGHADTLAMLGEIDIEEVSKEEFDRITSE